MFSSAVVWRPGGTVNSYVRACMHCCRLGGSVEVVSKGIVGVPLLLADLATGMIKCPGLPVLQDFNSLVVVPHRCT